MARLAKDCPDFKFIEFNERLAASGLDAARIQEDGVWFWVSKRDIELRIRAFGNHEELLKALSYYK
jgi:hypothetical protein